MSVENENLENQGDKMLGLIFRMQDSDNVDYDTEALEIATTKAEIAATHAAEMAAKIAASKIVSNSIVDYDSDCQPVA